MKKLIALALMLMLCCAAALAEDAVKNEIVNGSYVIRIPDPDGDLGWLADDMSQDDSVVKLGSQGLENGEYVVRYDPAGDGEMTVAVHHFTGIACDQLYTFDLTVKDGAVTECTGGSYTASPDPSVSDPYLIGEWEAADGMAVMAIEKNEGGRAWDVQINGAAGQNGYVFKTTIYYDCERNGFVYDKGKLWRVPITDSEEAPELGEADRAGMTGIFTFTGDPVDLRLTWTIEDAETQEIEFLKQAPAEK